MKSYWKFCKACLKSTLWKGKYCTVCYGQET